MADLHFGEDVAVTRMANVRFLKNEKEELAWLLGYSGDGTRNLNTGQSHSATT
jgi:hypothetical protein